MTISSEVRKTEPFIGNDVTTDLPFEFKVFSAEDMLVVRANAAGDETILVLDTDYTVTLNANQNDNPGGTVTLSAPLATGFTAVVSSDLENLQPTDLTNQGGFYPSVVTSALDRLTILVQQVAEGLGRAVKTKITDSRTGDELLADIFEAEENAAASANQAQEILNDIENAASPLVSQVIAAANSASASAIVAGNNATSSGNSSTSAAASAAAALAAAEASGSVVFYDTYALANAAVAGLPNLQVVQVLVDETRGSRRTIYRKEGGVLVFKTFATAEGKTIYVDSVAGNNANSGGSRLLAKQTLAGATAVLNAGDTLLLKANSRFFERFNPGVSNIMIGRYGNGRKPIVDGSRLIPAGAWIPDPTHAGVWYADVTHAVQPNNPNLGFAIWEETATTLPLNHFPKWALATIADNRAFVAANTGFFTAHRVGSTAPNPTTDTTGLQYRYYVKPVSGIDPTTGNVQFYYAEMEQVFNPPAGSVCRDIIVQRTGHKDMAGHNQQFIDLMQDMEFLEAYTHGWVGGSIYARRCRAKRRLAGGDYEDLGGGGLHFFAGTEQPFSMAEDCESDGFALNYYAHAGTALIADHVELRFRNCVSKNSRVFAFSAGERTIKGVHVDGFKGYNENGHFRVPARSIIKNYSVHSRPSPTQPCLNVSGSTGGRVTLENGVHISTGDFAQNQTAQTTGNASHTLDLYMTKVTKVGGQFSLSTLFKRFNIFATDCILGELAASYSTEKPFVSLTANNCQFSWYGREGIAEIQAIEPGVNSNCVIPWVTQKYEKLITSSLFTYRNTSRVGYNPDAGNLALVRTTADFTGTLGFNPNGHQIKILNYNGAGADHVCRIVAFTNFTDFTVSPPLPSQILVGTPRTIELAVFNKKITPAGDVTTAVFNLAGTQAYFTNVDQISEGMWIWFGAMGRRAPFGVRKIVTLSGQTATLDRAVPWNRHREQTIAYAGFGLTNGPPRPSVNTQFGFKLRGVIPGQPLPKMTVRVVYEASLARPDFTAVENDGSGGRAVFTNLINYDTNFVNRDATTGVIRHEIGEIDCGFTKLGEGDTLSVTAYAYIPELDVEYVADPFTTGKALLASNSLMAQLRMGAQPDTAVA